MYIDVSLCFLVLNAQVIDTNQLVRSSEDPALDVWTFVRSLITSAASAYENGDFLFQVKNMSYTVEQELRSNSRGFLEQRGLQIHRVDIIETEMADEELESAFVAAIATEAAERQTQLQQMISENQVNLARSEGAAAVAQQEQSKCAHNQLPNSQQMACINRCYHTLSMFCFVSSSLILFDCVHCALYYGDHRSAS
jgi:regulator of protease activity HflC (stomatin/prohibitin superfamily)